MWNYVDFSTSDRVDRLRGSLRAARHGWLKTSAHRALRRVFSDFDVNAWLRMYPMSYLDSEEWRTIIPAHCGTLLDVGAGSGDLTHALAPSFGRIVCTETSRGMARRLARLGFETHRLDLTYEPLPSSKHFDAVALLHVLDRCAQPLTLFERAIEYATPGALLMVAVTLPYDPLVDLGTQTLEPEERLVPRNCVDVFDARDKIADRLFEKRGHALHTVARVPYLCPGDADQEDYCLDSFLFIGTKKH